MVASDTCMANGPITDGLFCPGQINVGAFGQAAAEAITQVGSPAGDLSDGASHAGVLVSNFCMAPTGNIALDGIADLPVQAPSSIIPSRRPRMPCADDSAPGTAPGWCHTANELR
jgi:hypothetical protein